MIGDIAIIAYRKELLHLPATEINGITTTTLNPILLLRGLFKGFSHYGFDSNMPCTFEITVIDGEPSVKVTKDNGLYLSLAASINI